MNYIGELRRLVRHGDTLFVSSMGTIYGVGAVDEAGLRFDHIDATSGSVFNLGMLLSGKSASYIADAWGNLSPRLVTCGRFLGHHRPHVLRRGAVVHEAGAQGEASRQRGVGEVDPSPAVDLLQDRRVGLVERGRVAAAVAAAQASSPSSRQASSFPPQPARSRARSPKARSCPRAARRGTVPAHR